MALDSISYEEFVDQANVFVELSARLHDEWCLKEVSNQKNPAYIKKECFFNESCKAEYVVSYSLSYSVPVLAFNLWDSNGCLLTLEEIQLMSQYKFNKKEFYSAVTQQEHPLFFRPYYMVHPCHTEEILSTLRGSTKNLIVTFLSLVAPMCSLKLALDYGSSLPMLTNS